MVYNVTFYNVNTIHSIIRIRKYKIENIKRMGNVEPEEWSKFRDQRPDSFEKHRQVFGFPFRNRNGSSISSHRLNQIISDRLPKMMKLLYRKKIPQALPPRNKKR